MTREPELIILRGLPASGKTTWARAWVDEDPAHRVRVNKDDLREMFDHSVWSTERELRIVAARDVLVQKLMERGLSVVVDDTNFARHHIKKLARLAEAACWKWSVRDFVVPESECIRRDALRHKTVGRKVIESMYDRYIHGDVFPVIPTKEELFSDATEGDLYVLPEGKPWAVIIDIDGTVALKGTRNPFDETRVGEDAPNTPVLNVIRADVVANDVYPIFMSGRTAGCKEATDLWLQDHFSDVWQYSLFMRAVGDNRPDNIIKRELFDKHVRYNYRVARVYDDRNQVVQMWRSLGLTVLQVAEGNF